MLRLSLLLVLLTLVSATTPNQLPGTYEYDGRPSVTAEISQLTSTPPTFVATIRVNGQIKTNETMLIWPTPTGYAWENVAGNSGTLTQLHNGTELHTEVTTGPNRGHTAKWNRQP